VFVSIKISNLYERIFTLTKALLKSERWRRSACASAYFHMHWVSEGSARFKVKPYLVLLALGQHPKEYLGIVMFRGVNFSLND